VHPYAGFGAKPIFAPAHCDYPELSSQRQGKQMTHIVAAVFDDEQRATSAAHELRGAGFDASDLDQFALGPPGRHDRTPIGGDQPVDPQAQGGDKGAVKGAAVGTAIGAVAGLAAVPVIGPLGIAGGAAAGAYAGSLAGAAKEMGEERPTPQPRPAGVMVAVNAETADDEELAIDLLRDHGARMIERADGAWRNGRWADFDPVRPPEVIESRAAGSAQVRSDRPET
jgi:hypothetical protein